MGVLVDVGPCGVSDARQGAPCVHHCLCGYVLWVMQLDGNKPQAFALGSLDGWLCLEVVEVIDLRESGRAGILSI